MSPYIIPLAPSESKTVFMRRLGLNLDDLKHKRLYKSMKSDAIASYIEITSHRGALLPQLQDDQAVIAPYTYAQISETALHRAIIDIYSRANDDTRVYYDIGHSTKGVETENWVIRWLLWHVFRYRDRRNRSVCKSNATTTINIHERPMLYDGSPGDSNDETDTIVTQDGSDYSPPTLPPLHTVLSNVSGISLSSPTSRLPYDPARD